ncbi:MAG: hypothetical protein ABSD38_19310 [Syntrophorhabdales bacterium]|jgi:hypothetical protein
MVTETPDKIKQQPTRRSGWLQDEAGRRKHERTPADKPSPYISPGELARRWRCSRSTVDRIARRGGLRRLLLGEGKNGMVRYVLCEVEELERKSTI